MSATNIPVGSPLAKKLFSVGLFSRVQTAPGFLKLLSGPMPQVGSFGAKGKEQTSPDYPIVKTGDLAKTAGDSVSVDLFNILQGKPTMGDKRIAGRMMPLRSSSMDVRIDQARGGADGGGRMTQKRTVHNLRNIALKGLEAWMGRLEDQTALVHLAGARGVQNTTDWVIPLSGDPEFSEIMVNTVKAPTKNRYFCANDATNPSTIGTNDALSFTDVERIVAELKESPISMQSIRVSGDDSVWDDPLWLMFVTERQWFYLKSRASSTQWRAAIQNAFQRKTPGVKHPIFDNMNTIMWDGMMIRPMNRYAIRFNTGSSVIVDTGGADGNTYTESTVTSAQPVDRAIIVGAQALAKVYGSSGSDYYYDWSEEKVDHGNSVEVVAAQMGGCAKVRFKIDNVDTDYGVAVVDSYAPALSSNEGKTLAGS